MEILMIGTLAVALLAAPAGLLFDSPVNYLPYMDGYPKPPGDKIVQELSLFFNVVHSLDKDTWLIAGVQNSVTHKVIRVDLNSGAHVAWSGGVSSGLYTGNHKILAMELVGIPYYIAVDTYRAVDDNTIFLHKDPSPPDFSHTVTVLDGPPL